MFNWSVDTLSLQHVNQLQLVQPVHRLRTLLYRRLVKLKPLTKLIFVSNSQLNNHRLIGLVGLSGWQHENEAQKSTFHTIMTFKSQIQHISKRCKLSSGFRGRPRGNTSVCKRTCFASFWSFLKLGLRVEKCENAALAFSCGQWIHILCVSMMPFLRPSTS